ncbi:hypothetical protein ATCC90586_001614 [Pythium insidiosum]|nr:hypothetical protein ATCC90586_001614 [Pythium insidiosum]
MTTTPSTTRSSSQRGIRRARRRDDNTARAPAPSPAPSPSPSPSSSSAKPQPTLSRRAVQQRDVWTIWYAAQHGNATRVQTLLDRRSVVSIDVPETRTRWTALHFAAHGGHVEVVQLLLERGADPELRDAMGNTPLHLSAGWGNLRTTVLLLEAGASPSVVNDSGLSALQLAQRLARREQLRVLEDWQPLQISVDELAARRLDATSALFDPLAARVAALSRLQRELEDEPNTRVRQELHALHAKTLAHGVDHESHLVTLARLVGLYSDDGRWQTALETSERGLTLSESCFGRQHSETLAWLNDTGELLSRLGRLEEAEHHLEEAADGLAQLQGDCSLDALSALENLAIACYEQKHWEDVERHLHALVSRLATQLGGSCNERVLLLRLRLSVALIELRRIAEARELLTELLGHALTLLDAKSLVIATCHERIAQCEFLLGEFEPAERSFQAAMGIARSHDDSHDDSYSNPHRQRLLNNLAIVAIAKQSASAVRVKLQELLKPRTSDDTWQDDTLLAEVPTFHQ